MPHGGRIVNFGAPSGLIRGRVQVDFETFQSPRARSPRKSEHTVVIRRVFSAELHSDGLRIDFKSYMPVAAPDARGAPISRLMKLSATYYGMAADRELEGVML